MLRVGVGSVVLVSILLAMEGRASVVAQQTSLADVVKQSDLIVLAVEAIPATGTATFKGAPPDFRPLVARYRPVEVLHRRGRTIAVGAVLEVFPADLDIQLGQHLASKRPQRGPNPIFSLPVYHRAAEPKTRPSRRLLFLSQDAGRRIWRFVCGNSWETESARTLVRQLLAAQRTDNKKP
jgi:hypothetical protein